MFLFEKTSFRFNEISQLSILEDYQKELYIICDIFNIIKYKCIEISEFFTDITKNEKQNINEMVLFMKNLFADPGQPDSWIAGIMKAQTDGKVPATLAFTDIQGRRLRLALNHYGDIVEITVTPIDAPLFGGH